MFRKLSAFSLLLLVVLSLAFGESIADARGTCFPGNAYKDAGTTHNYVQFRVNISSRTGWHVERPYWSFPIDLWAYPDGNGIANAGINMTDWNPPYSPSAYLLCTGQ